MFAKSLTIAAVLAMSAEAVKIKTGTKSLAGINLSALSQSELAALRAQTQNQFHEDMNKWNVHRITHEQVEADNDAWLEAKVKADNMSNDHVLFAPQVHDLYLDEALARNNIHVPEDQQELALAANKYGFKLEMTTEEYQALYDQKWSEAQDLGWTCKKFDRKFNKKDNKYIAKQEEKQHNKKVNKKGWSEDDFDSWWMRIWQDRTLAQSSITRCFDDDNNDDNNDNNNDDNNNDDNGNDDNDNDDNGNDDNGNDDNGNDDQLQCSASNAEFVWGDNVVTPIKNQGQCGSCYAFSAMTVMESAQAIATGQQVQSLSEQQIVDCQNNYSSCSGCNGGWPASLHSSTKQHPVHTTASYPYTAREESCKSPESATVACEDVYYIENNDIDSMKQALCVGPVTLTVQANGPFMSYSSGVMTSADCPYSSGNLDHAVAAIGWKIMDGQEVLVVRNSWGTWWGDNGYAFLALDGGNNGMGPCGIMEYPSSCTVSGQVN